MNPCGCGNSTFEWEVRLIPSPIHRVLSTLSSHEVQHLLMGGQACVFYGAAEFSRDCDIVLLSDDDNFLKLTEALAALQAKCIAVPPWDWRYLEQGHAIHFRCLHPDALNIRIDVMTRMRGCDAFPVLWTRRTTLEDADGMTYELLGIEDLIGAKKTQRDKDWPMIRRLVDAHYDEFASDPTDERIRFWLKESRSPAAIIELAEMYPRETLETQELRPLLQHAKLADSQMLEDALRQEQAREQQADAEYWEPLKRDLERMRAARRK